MGRHQSLPSGSLHKPVEQPHSPEGRQKEKELQFCNLRNEDHKHKKLDKMRWQRNMFQMKDQDKTPEKQPSKVEIGNLLKKISE